ncbi:MAG: transporter substrate-binding domain-containing protein, partial [Nevskiaceae bacterium]|nr:transporter substrate-binding domain-containing protein [Nevskiaceae bacterium]
MSTLIPRSFFILLLTLCGFLGAPGAQAAQGAWEQVLARGVLRVGVPGDYAPYALWRDSGAAIDGVDAALAREVAASLGLGIEFVPTTWKALQDDAHQRRFDVAVGGISVTPERRREFGFTRALARDFKAPLVRCGDEPRYRTRAQINDPRVRVVANPGGTNESFARSSFPAAQLTIHADNIGVFDEVAAGRADVFVTDEVEARLQARLHPGLCVVEAAPDWQPVNKSMLVVDADARRAVDKAVGAALRRRSYDARLDDWLAHEWRLGAALSSDAARELARLADERLVTVVEVARWKWNTKAPIEDPPREASLMAAQRAAAQG